jgi:CBS-domain-containing membrane protein
MLDPKVKSNPRPYVLQCSLAFFALLVVLLVEEVGLHRVVMIAAIGSTSFVLFVTPHSSTANPRHVIGGHLVALVVGSAFAVFSGTPVGQNLLAQVPLVLDVEAALAVALSIFFMAATDTEHAPAAGTALGVVVHGFGWGLILFVVSSAIMLSFVHTMLRPRLRDLL